MCKQSANTQTVVQNPTIPDWLSNQFQSLATRAQGVSDRPYNPGVQRNVADFTPDQLQSFQQVRQDQGIYQPYMNAATGYAQIGGSTINGNQIANYSNPYQQQVIDATMANIQSNNATQQANLRGNAALQGGLGNDRLKIAQAELAKNQNLATNQTLATLNAQNYNQALGAAQQDRSAAQQAASQFANLGSNMQSMANRDAAALLQTGGLQQALTQQQLDTTSANIAQQEQYPFATASWLGGMLQGASPSFTGSQQTSTTPGPSALSQIAGLGMLGYGLLSDERAKENIEPIGEDFGGNTIYRFNYKGSPETEIGYIAQDIAETNPDAVGVGPDGFLRVDYKDVTDDIMPPEREGFNAGGYTVGGTYSVDKNNIIRMSGAGQPGQATPYGASNTVPQQSMSAGSMLGAAPIKKLPAPKSKAGQMYDEAKEIAGDLQGMQKAGEGLGMMADQGMRSGMGVSMKPFSNYGPPVPEGLARGGRVGYALGGGVYGPAAEMIPGQPSFAGTPTPYGASNIVPPAPQPAMRPAAGLGMGAAPGSFRAAQQEPGIPTGPAEGSFRAAQQEGMPSDDGQTIAGAQGSNGLTGSAGLGGLFGPMSDPARQGVIQAGLGMLAGTSPHAMVNIGRGGQVGYAAYQQAVAAEQRKAQEALQNRIAEEKLRMMTEEFKQRQLEFQENAPLRQAQIAEAQRRASEPGFERRQEIEREQAIKRVEAEREIKKREALEAGYGPETPEYKAHVFGMRSQQRSDLSEQVEARRQEALKSGLDPDREPGRTFVLTGKMPREDQQPLTATDKKAILDADEAVQANQQAIALLDEALKINPKANTGMLAGTRAAVGNMLPDIMVPDIVSSKESSKATADYENIVIGQALSQMKSIFGAAPTEGERKILLELQGSVGQPIEVRKGILERAKRAAEARLKFNAERAAAMRSQSYYTEPGRQQTSGSSGAPSPADAQSPTENRETKTIDGKTYVKVNGQWYAQ